MVANAYLEEADSPAGKVVFTTNGEGALLGLKFLEGSYPLTLEEELGCEGFTLIRRADGDASPARRVREQLNDYFSGERRTFDVPLAFRGTEFQKAVWEKLSRIPFGETRTYAGIAGEIGKPGAARAVGRAVSTNRIPLVVPCHRVVGADGSLIGFAGGAHLKERLLAFERSSLATLDGLGEDTVQLGGVAPGT